MYKIAMASVELDQIGKKKRGGGNRDSQQLNLASHLYVKVLPSPFPAELSLTEKVGTSGRDCNSKCLGHLCPLSWR